MEPFNEKTHACIAGLFYLAFCREDPSKAEEAFIRGTRAHGMSRGRRMALRALRDGQPLDFRSYFRYGEWRPSAYAQSLRRPSVSILRRDPDYVIAIPSCLWHEQFQEMGLGKAEHIYCAHIDRAIVGGFSPELRYETLQTLADCSCCIQKACDARFGEDEDLSRREADVKEFDFHCANSFYAYKESAEACFPGKGEAIARQVLDSLAESLGQEAVSVLQQYEGYDFGRI